VDGHVVTWAGWSLRWRADRRTGVELVDVRFDAGTGPRRVLYEAYLSDLFVPYQDPDPAWAFRTLLDSAEFGLGNTISRLAPGVDCPTHATFLDTVIPSDDGAGSTRPSTLCIFERPTGDPAWRHSGSGTDLGIGSGAVELELVMRFIATIGNYDYIVDYVFTPDGALRFDVFAAGVVLQKAVDETGHDHEHAVGIDEHGVLVGEGLLATNHDHYMNFRLDVDVGETANRMVRAVLTPEQVEGDPGRTVVWDYVARTVASEADGHMTPVPDAPEVVVFEAATADGPLGHRPGLELDFGDAVAVAPGDVSGDPGLRRGGWAEETVWVTPYSRDERFASGLYVPDGSAPAGLPAWVAQDRPLVDTDLVLWFTVGFHHIVRTEDLPTMPAHEASFGLVPINTFPYNPYLDF
jgi:primary-amine oxidase